MAASIHNVFYLFIYMPQAIFKYDYPFTLESGISLPQLVIAYHTYGTLNPQGDNVIWVCHALTASSDVADWWPHTVETDRFLDPDRHFIICANILGSHYGTTGPLHTNPDSGQPYYADFPTITIRDMAAAHQLLADHLGIKHITALIGSSLGGFQALEWAIANPTFIEKLVLIATAPKASPWAIAFDQTQRMAIFADKSFGQPHPEAGTDGLAAARAIALLSYRGESGYNITQQDPDDVLRPAEAHRASTYQIHQGQKLKNRFNAYSYVSILNSFDSHDVGRNRGGVPQALKLISAKTLTVGISTDLLFTTTDMKSLNSMIRDSRYYEIDSPFGHDGFLVEHQQLNNILYPFINEL